MPPNMEKYRKYVDHFDISEKQKVELIHTLWTIMESFADQAFGLHPAQQVEGIAARIGETGDSNGVESKLRSISRSFIDVVAPETPKEEKYNE